jgi:two-component system sensor histidine kinase YesM
VPIDEELGFAEDYMDVQRYRYGGRLSYRQQVDPGVRDVLIPKATIQTLVENACVHGLLERDADGAIEITVAQAGSEVVIKVADNGAGCDPEPVRALFEAEVGEHIGIPNVYQRLRLHYGEAASLEFESKPGAGTTVTVRYTPKEAE